MRCNFGKTQQWARTTWFVWKHKTACLNVFSLRCHLAWCFPLLVSWSDLQSECSCKRYYNCGLSRLFRVFSDTQAISQLDVLFFLFRQSGDWFSFNSMVDLWKCIYVKCNKRLDRLRCMLAYSSPIVLCIIYHLYFCFSRFWVDCLVTPFLLFLYWTA